MQPVNETLAYYSELFMLIAALVYLVAFLAFCWDMATASRTIRKLEAELAAEREGVPVLVGSKGYAIASSEETQPGADSELRVESQPPAEFANDDMEYSGELKRPAANIAVAVMVLGLAVHLAAVVCAVMAAKRAPWGNLYEFLTSGALVVAAVYLVFLIRKDLRFVGVFVSGLVVLMMTAATIGFPTPIANVQPALQSWWLIVHVSVAVMGTGIFTLTAAMSILQLIKQHTEKSQKKGWSFLRLVPSAVSLENWSYRLSAVGFVMWTFTLMCGAIWAEQAWGRYWGWDAKEVWTFVIWVLYAAYLHARATRGWTGTRAAWLNIAGFIALVFNYSVVNLYFPSLHSYAGVS